MAKEVCYVLIKDHIVKLYFKISKGMIRIPLILTISFLFSACATMHPSARITHVGQYNPNLDKQRSEESAKNIKADDIEVYLGELPDGLVLMERSSRLEFDRNAYKLLAVAEASFPIEEQRFRNAFWTWNYRGIGRNILCGIQAPLKLITLSLWTWQPLHYPCRAVVPGNEHKREKLLVKELRKSAKVVGADILILSGANHLQMTAIDDSYSYENQPKKQLGIMVF